MEKMPTFPETEEKKTFDLYVKDFGIDLNAIKNKSIFDIGCGSDTLFVKYCLRRNISIIGMDTREPESADKDLLIDHYIQGNINQIPFPPNSFDLILIRAVPVGDYAMLKSILPLLKPNGELKLAPLFLDDNDLVSEEIEQLVSSVDPQEFEVSKQIREIQRTNSDREDTRYLLTIKRKP